jgi:hypothetical protein
MASSTILPHEIVSDVPGYHDVSVLYAVGYLQTFRARRNDDGKDVFLNLCPTAHLETLARLRHTWTLEQTSREIFLSREPYISSGSGIDVLPSDLSAELEPMLRSRADILALLKAFITVH